MLMTEKNKDLPQDETEEILLSRYYKDMNNFYPGNQIGPIYTWVAPAPLRTTSQAIMCFNTANEAARSFYVVWTWGYVRDGWRMHVMMCASKSAL